MSAAAAAGSATSPGVLDEGRLVEMAIDFLTKHSHVLSSTAIGAVFGELCAAAKSDDGAYPFFTTPIAYNLLSFEKSHLWMNYVWSLVIGGETRWRKSHMTFPSDALEFINCEFDLAHSNLMALASREEDGDDSDGDDPE